MKRIAYRSVLILALCAMLLTTGCIFGKKPAQTTDDNTAQILAELNAMKEQLDAANSELEALKQEGNTDSVQAAPAQSSPAETTPTEPSKQEPEVIEIEIPVELIVAENCTINGETTVPVDGQTKVHAVANAIEGYVFDHWEINGGVALDGGEEADFTFNGPTALCAVYRERCVLTLKNCHITLLNDKGNSAGKSYTEFDFEEDYVNPETKKTVAGGTIDFYIFADIPKGKEVDHWLVNGVVYEAPYNNVTKFRVQGLTEATVFEVVFK